MQRICFIVTSFWAYGELTIAIEFALRLRDAGYEPLFLIPPSHEKILKQNNITYLTLIPKSRKLNLLLLHQINEKYNPAAVVLADFLNYRFCQRHYGLTEDDLSIFSGKMGAFDIYDFETTNGRVDTYGFQAANMRDISLKSYDFLLQPCPVNHVRKGEGREFRYNLLGEVKKRSAEEKQKANESLGLKKDEKIILITSAVWQQRYRLYENIVPFIKACNQMMERVFDTLPPNIKIISVGAQTLYLNQKKSNFSHYDEMLPHEFRKITQAADLYISNNFVSTSMIKIVLSGIPTLLIQNSIYKRDDTSMWLRYKNRKLPEILDQCPLAYPFRFFPVGWYNFLKDMVKNNAFYSLMPRQELFVPGKLKEKILELLYDPEMFTEKRQTFLESLKKLPSVQKDFTL